MGGRRLCGLRGGGRVVCGVCGRFLVLGGWDSQFGWGVHRMDGHWGNGGLFYIFTGYKLLWYFLASDALVPSRRSWVSSLRARESAAAGKRPELRWPGNIVVIYAVVGDTGVDVEYIASVNI